MLSGNKYTSRSSLGSVIYLGKKVKKMCFSKGGIL